MSKIGRKKKREKDGEQFSGHHNDEKKGHNKCKQTLSTNTYTTIPLETAQIFTYYKQKTPQIIIRLTCTVPGRKPGTSTKVTIGMLKESKKRTNLAALIEESMSKQPAR